MTAARLIFAPAAEADLAGIALFIAQDKPDAALGWVQTLRAKCEWLVANPKAGEERQGFGIPGCRSFTVGSYVVFFRGIHDGIEVARIIHGSRDLENM